MAKVKVGVKHRRDLDIWFTQGEKTFRPLITENYSGYLYGGGGRSTLVTIMTAIIRITASRKRRLSIYRFAIRIRGTSLTVPDRNRCRPTGGSAAVCARRGHCHGRSHGGGSPPRRNQSTWA
jgi:hypothetical protein